MFFTDYRIQRTTINASNGARIRNIYTTEFPCLLWVEIPVGELAGFNATFPSCFFDIVYTGDTVFTSRTFIWGNSRQLVPGGTLAQTLDTNHGTTVGYCPRAGVTVRFDTQDDDHSGFVNLHILRLPESDAVITDVTL